MRNILTIIAILWFISVVAYIFVEYVGTGKVDRWVAERYEDNELKERIIYQGRTYRIYGFDIQEGRCYVVETINHDLSISCLKK